MAAPGSDSVISPIVETCWPPSRGVSSSGAVGIVTIMKVRSVGGGLQEGMGEREKECASRSLFSGVFGGEDRLMSCISDGYRVRELAAKFREAGKPQFSRTDFSISI